MVPNVGLTSRVTNWKLLKWFFPFEWVEFGERWLLTIRFFFFFFWEISNPCGIWYEFLLRWYLKLFLIAWNFGTYLNPTLNCWLLITSTYICNCGIANTLATSSTSKKSNQKKKNLHYFSSCIKNLISKLGKRNVGLSVMALKGQKNFQLCIAVQIWL